MLSDTINVTDCGVLQKSPRHQQREVSYTNSILSAMTQHMCDLR